MNMYQYVAEHDPAAAKAVLHKHGYRISGVKTTKDLGECLQQLVAAEGEDALKDLVKVHPDRELILEVTQKESLSFLGIDGAKPVSASHHGCNCKACLVNKEGAGAYAGYVNFTGEETAVTSVQRTNSNLLSQTNAMLLGSAFLLAIAIIATNRK